MGFCDPGSARLPRWKVGLEQAARSSRIRFAVFPPLRRGFYFPPPCEGGFIFPPLAKGVSFFPPLRRGGRGGGPGTISHKVFPCSLLFQRIRSWPLTLILLHPSREAGRVVFDFQGSRPTPPGPPFARGGKGSVARAVVRLRATKTRVSKPSLQ